MGASRRDLYIAFALAALVATLLAATARADVGVERASRHSGRAGDQVRLTIACGFCFPPCVGPKGERRPEGFERGPCMLDGGKEPPASFAVSLLPRRRAERLVACQVAGSDCPAPKQAPHRGPYHYLGEATPPPGGNNPETGEPPRYLLSFEIPRLAPGQYAYVIWCDACRDGKAGTLVTDPASPRWLLQRNAING